MTAVTASTAPAVPTARRASAGRPNRIVQPWLGVPFAGALAGAWGTLCFAPDLSTHPWEALCTVVVTVGFGIAAAVLVRQPGRHGVGVLLLSAAVLWPLNSLGGWSVGPMTFLRQFTEAVFWVVVASAVLLHQHPRLQRPERWFLGWLTLEFVGGQLFWTAVSRPEWSGLPAVTWWPSIHADRALYEVTSDVLGALYLPTTLVFAVLLATRARRSAPIDRYRAAPVIVAIGVAGVAASISWSAYETTTITVAVVLMPLPLAFLYSSSRLAQLRVRLGAALDARPDGSGSAGGYSEQVSVTAALRSVLRDPDLTIAFWSPERRGWVDEAGRPSPERPSAVPLLEIRVPGGVLVTTADTSPAARRDVEAAVRLAATSIENAGLRAVVKAQVDSVARAHARTVQAAVRERRRLEQDLHDGAQQRLLGVLTHLTIARLHAEPGTVAEVIEDIDVEVRRALGELRDLAHGLHPAVLTREGLVGGLESLARRAACPVDLHVDTGHLGQVLETSLYYIVCEALTNVSKHAQAGRAWVRAETLGAVVELEVGDDGVGGADSSGFGLQGIADRAVALGGRVSITSPIGVGTRVRVELPCA